MKDPLQKIFIVWLTLIPFVIWKGSYEGPKVFYFFAGCIALFIFWIIRILVKKKDFEFDKTDYFFLLWIFVLTVASIFGIHPLDSIFGGSYRHQGVIFSLGLWVLAKTIQILSPAGKKLLIKSAGISVIVESVIVLLQLAGGDLYMGRPLGTLGETNAVAGTIAMGIYFVYLSFPKLIVLLPIAAIASTFSRAGILSVLFSAGIYIKGISKKIKYIFPVLVIAVLFALIIITGEKGNSPFENREVIWNLGINEIIKRPILGFGAETGEAVYNKAFYVAGFPLSGLIIDRTHNLFLDVLMWSGIVGLIFFGGWLITGYKNLNSIEKKLAFFSFLVYSMFQPLSIVHWIFLIFIFNI